MVNIQNTVANIEYDIRDINDFDIRAMNDFAGSLQKIIIEYGDIIIYIMENSI